MVVLVTVLFPFLLMALLLSMERVGRFLHRDEGVAELERYLESARPPGPAPPDAARAARQGAAAGRHRPR